MMQTYGRTAQWNCAVKFFFKLFSGGLLGGGVPVNKKTPREPNAGLYGLWPQKRKRGKEAVRPSLNFLCYLNNGANISPHCAMYLRSEII
jgi:hypothetical protein